MRRTTNVESVEQSHRRFAWGVGTSAYQIEGAWDADGKGVSIWDTMAHSPLMSATGDVACDHYHRLDEDLDLLAELGVTAYRFSTAWTRVLPEGTGQPNRAGLDFYDRLVDGLLDRGIDPWLTLYHWDLPQALQDRGGWANRQSTIWFAEYAQLMATSLGDRVENWITVNEPWVSSFLGHRDGLFAPGLHDWPTAVAAAHHQLMGHGIAVSRIKEAAPSSRVGIALDCRPAIPASDSADDMAATHHFDGFRNRWFFDPVFGKGYPTDIVAVYRESDRLREGLIKPGDEDLIATPIDFCGVNYYTSIRVSAGTEEFDFPEGPMGAPAKEGYTEMGWLIDPDALEGFLNRVHDDWSPKSIIVTENGASFSAEPDGTGVVRDRERIEYVDRHIAAVQRARTAGVRVDGYFLWSFLDNLEWRAGFSQRFGIVWVDHETQQRIPKDSAYWYRDRIAAETSG